VFEITPYVTKRCPVITELFLKVIVLIGVFCNIYLILSRWVIKSRNTSFCGES
jgi:hypothetical protein